MNGNGIGISVWFYTNIILIDKIDNFIHIYKII